MKPRGVVVIEETEGRCVTASDTGCSAFEQIGNRPIAHHVVDDLCAAGVAEIVVACSTHLYPSVHEHLAACETQSGVELKFVHQPGPVDFAQAMALALPVVGRAPCIVHAGSGLLGEPLAPLLLDSAASDAPDVILFTHQGASAGGHLRDIGDAARLGSNRTGLGLVRVAVLGSGALELAASAERCTGGEVDFTGLARDIADAGGAIRVRVSPSWHGYTGGRLDLLELNRTVLDRLENQVRHRGVNGTRIEGRVHIHETASIGSSVIVGPVIIGPGAWVHDAYVGPYTAIGAGARVEGVEIERSIVAPGARITHVGCRLEGSVIGRDARVFRDFSLPRALRLRVGEGTEVALS